MELSKLSELRQYASIDLAPLYYIEFPDVIALTYLQIIRALRNKIGFAALAMLKGA